MNAFKFNYKIKISNLLIKNEKIPLNVNRQDIDI